MTEPRGDGMQRPSGFELPRAGFVAKVMEVQIDLGEFRSPNVFASKMPA